MVDVPTIKQIYMKKLFIVLALSLLFVTPVLAEEDVCPPACSVVGLQFLGPDQNLNPANFVRQWIVAPLGIDLVRRSGKDFFLNGRHIELPEFKSLRINADWVADGATVSLEDVR